MATKNINTPDFDPDISDSDSSDTEIGGEKKKLNPKILIFFVFVLLVLGMLLFFLFSPGKKDETKPVKPKSNALSLPVIDEPKPTFIDAPKANQSNDSITSSDLLKKRLLDFSDKDFMAIKAADETKYQQQSSTVVKKVYGSNLNEIISASSSSASSNSIANVQEDPSQALIKRRSLSSGTVSIFLGGQLVPQTSEGKYNHSSLETQQKTVVSPSPTAISANNTSIDNLVSSLKGDVLNPIAGDTIPPSKVSPAKAVAGKNNKLSVASSEVKNNELKNENFHTASVARKIAMNPSFFVPQGTQIRCVMQTMLIPDVKGNTSCSTAEDIRSFDGSNVLIPKGSTVIGEYDKKPKDLDRMPMIWTRVITPDNIDVSLDNSPGGTLLGAAAMSGYTDNNWARRLGSALLISMGADAFALTLLKHAPTTSVVTPSNNSTVVTQTPFNSTTVKTIQSTVDDELKKSLTINPTFVILQGSVGTIYVMRDLDFSKVYSKR